MQFWLVSVEAVMENDVIWKTGAEVLYTTNSSRRITLPERRQTWTWAVQLIITPFTSSLMHDLVSYKKLVWWESTSHWNIPHRTSLFSLFPILFVFFTSEKALKAHKPHFTTSYIHIKQAGHVLLHICTDWSIFKQYSFKNYIQKISSSAVLREFHIKVDVIPVLWTESCLCGCYCDSSEQWGHYIKDSAESSLTHVMLFYDVRAAAVQIISKKKKP